MAFVVLILAAVLIKTKWAIEKRAKSDAIKHFGVCKINSAKMSPEQPQICDVTSSFILLNIFFKLSVSRHLHGIVQKDANILGIFLCVVVSGRTSFGSEVCLVF